MKWNIYRIYLFLVIYQFNNYEYSYTYIKLHITLHVMHLYYYNKLATYYCTYIATFINVWFSQGLND